MEQRTEDSIRKWHKWLQKYITDEAECTKVMGYVSAVLGKGLPVIVGVNHLAKLTGVDSDTMKSMITSSRSFYRTFMIPKRKGGLRKIEAPYPTLLKVQRWIYESILLKIPLNEDATGFVRGKSIVNNAEVHVGKKCVVKMDVQDFFPSIKWYQIYAIFHRLGYPKNISQYLTSLCCLNGAIPQGAATSPALSNIFSKRLDARLAGLSKKYSVVYTRYADDVTFSGDYISRGFVGKVHAIFADERLTLNEKKNRWLRGNCQKIITGISISSGKMKVPRFNRRIVRQQVYYIRKYGLYNHMERIGVGDPVYLLRLIGYLNFWKSVEPGNEFVCSSLIFLSEISAANEKQRVSIEPIPQQIEFEEFVLNFE